MPVMGGYNQGTPITRGPAQPVEAGRPTRTPQGAKAPRGEQHQKESHKTAGRNGHTAH